MYARRKGGNGYNGRQWFYVLGNLPYFWIIKQGVTGRPLLERVKEIDESSPGWDFPIFAVVVRFAYPVEKFFKDITKPKKLLSFLRIKSFKGSGKTERFLFVIAFFSIPAAIIVAIIEWITYVALCVLFFYLLTKM